MSALVLDCGTHVEWGSSRNGSGDGPHRDSDGRVDRDVERAYRRGFHQGAHAVLDALQAGASVANLGAWATGPLYEWRYAWNPMPGRSATGWFCTPRVSWCPPPAAPVPRQGRQQARQGASG